MTCPAHTDWSSTIAFIMPDKFDMAVLTTRIMDFREKQRYNRTKKFVILSCSIYDI